MPFAVLLRCKIERKPTFVSKNQIYFCFPDVDVSEPDEKSIITYVSFLYDLFPNVPTLEQSLRDNVSWWNYIHLSVYYYYSVSLTCKASPGEATLSSSLSCFFEFSHICSVLVFPPWSNLCNFMCTLNSVQFTSIRLSFLYSFFHINKFIPNGSYFLSCYIFRSEVILFSQHLFIYSDYDCFDFQIIWTKILYELRSYIKNNFVLI